MAGRREHFDVLGGVDVQVEIVVRAGLGLDHHPLGAILVVDDRTAIVTTNSGLFGWSACGQVARLICPCVRVPGLATNSIFSVCILKKISELPGGQINDPLLGEHTLLFPLGRTGVVC